VEQTDLLRLAVETLEDLRIPYAIIGAFASGAWGESRFTQDIDILVGLDSDKVRPLCQAFIKCECYVSETAANEAVQQRGQFNVIHPASGNKIDFMIAGQINWTTVQLQRRRRLRLLPDREADVASPEDVILGKLLYYAEGGSEKHVRDIGGIIKISGEALDLSYVNQFATQLGVAEIWQEILKRISGA
jgi:hypothetical protein